MRRAALALLTACLAATAASAGHELDDRDLALGAALYAEHCAACHGAELEGQPDWRQPDENGILPAPPHDASGHTWHHSNAQLFDYTKIGGQGVIEKLRVKGFTSGMPAFGGVLADDEIWHILAYIRSTWPERERELQASRNPPND